MEMKRELTRYMRPARVMMLGVAMLSLAGCVKRELEIRPDEGYVEIALDWTQAQSSRSARYLFYNESGALVKEVSGVTDCFKGTLPVGVYRLIVHNTDAGQVDWQGTEQYESTEVFAKETNYSEGHHPAEGVPCIQEPREVFATGGCNESETVEVRQRDTTRLSVTPVELTKRVAVRFTVEANGDASVRSLRGVLGGVSHGFFPGKGCHNASSSCAVEFTAAPGTKAASDAYTARVNVFGLLATSQSPAGTNTMHVTLDLDDGSQSTGTFDLTPTLQQLIAANGGVLPDEIPLDVTLRVQQEVGLSATVQPWKNGTGSGDIETGIEPTRENGLPLE